MLASLPAHATEEQVRPKKKSHYQTSSWQPEVAVSMPPAIWTGVYAGLSGGYAWGASEQMYDRAGDHGLASTSPAGALAALSVGYNHQFDGGLVLGIEGDIGLIDASDDDRIVY
ncbi:MAG: hypothetical protein ACRCS9_12845, partial [Hyphomicrobium sp.]